MKLKAPQGTTHVQSPTKVYKLDSNGFIEVADDSPDLAILLSMGFRATTLAPSETPYQPATNNDEGDDNGTL